MTRCGRCVAGISDWGPGPQPTLNFRNGVSAAEAVYTPLPRDLGHAHIATSEAPILSGAGVKERAPTHFATRGFSGRDFGKVKDAFLGAFVSTLRKSVKLAKIWQIHARICKEMQEKPFSLVARMLYALLTYMTLHVTCKICVLQTKTFIAT